MGKTPSNPVVPRCFAGATIACLGGGPSLTKEDVESLRGRARVVAINDGHRIAPWADVLYAADKEWWREYHGVPSFHGLKFALPDTSRWPWPSDITVLRNAGDMGLELDPSGLRTGGISGGNSGYQAINLAVHLGAKRIVLLGYDMQRTNGKTHWFGNHPDNLHRNSPFAEFLKGFPTLVKPLAKLGIEIVNCSRVSALQCFDRQPLEQALAVSVAA